MKGNKRPQMLLYLLVGALLLSTVLNAYFLLRLDARLVEQQVEAQLRDDESAEPPSVSARLPGHSPAPDTLRPPQP